MAEEQGNQGFTDDADENSAPSGDAKNMWQQIDDSDGDLEPEDQGPQVLDVPVHDVEVVENPGLKTEDSMPGHVEMPHPVANEIAEEDQSFGDEFWEILEQAGISKGAFFAFLFGLLALIGLIVFFLFGGLNIFDFGSGDEIKEPEKVERIVIEDTVEEVDEDDEVIGVLPSFIFGLEFTPGVVSQDFQPIGRLGSDAGIRAAYVFGLDFDPIQEDIVYYFQVLRSLQNAYETDVYALLDNSVNRRATLNDFIVELDELLIEAESIFDEINLKLNQFDAEYGVVSADRDFYEQSFFDSVDSLSGENAYDFLFLFVESGQSAFEIRAIFNAYSSLSDMYLNALSQVQPFYDDIVANENAIVKGVRIFDVPASDIDAILPID